MTESLAKKVIVALDVNTEERALALADALQDAGCWLKVGLELYARGGLAFVGKLKTRGFSVFLDLKLHDIPTTVEKTLRVLVSSGADMINVHCGGGYDMMARSAEVCRAGGVKLIGVTVLTSMGQEALWQTGVESRVDDQVSHLAALARRAGLDGVVSSAGEAARLRQECGEEFLLVTPGIRPSWSAADDQARVFTPTEALRAGSSYLVVGRPVTQAIDPRAALGRLWD